jgi:sporulation protein YlmC with PRC-barrel domain
MNRSVKHLHACTLVGRDGELGPVEEMYFDDEKWTIRYIVTNLEEVPDRERAAVSPVSVDDVDWKSRTILVALSRDEVAGSPEIEPLEPIGRDKERQLSHYYGIPVYWSGVGLWGNHVYPGLLAGEDLADVEDRSDGENRVHRTKEAFGFKIQATDGEIGRVDDLVLEEKTWEILFLVIGAGTWLPGKKVIVDTHWIEKVNWQDGTVRVSLPRDAIRSATAI